MSENYLSYNDLVDIAREHLDTIDNIKHFCIENDLPYTSIIALRNQSKNIPYTKLIVKLLTLFGYEIKKETFFLIKSSNN